MLSGNVFVNVFKSDAVIWWAAIFRRGRGERWRGLAGEGCWRRGCWEGVFGVCVWGGLGVWGFSSFPSFASTISGIELFPSRWKHTLVDKKKKNKEKNGKKKKRKKRKEKSQKKEKRERKEKKEKKKKKENNKKKQKTEKKEKTYKH